MSSESMGSIDGSDDVATDDPLLEIRGLKKHFSQSEGMLDQLFGDAGTVRAVDGVDLTIENGETLAVVGESGCGKSTLGRALLNLHEPTDGTVAYRGEDIAGASERKMRPYRRDLQMIFQNPLGSLNPRQSVREILLAPMEVHGIGTSDEDRLDRARQVLERVGLREQHLNRYPHQFSGGQQQRIAIARVLSLEPEFIVADEPTSALDVSVQAQIINLLTELQDDLDLAMLFITHDLSVVRHVADRVAVMYLGEIVETAPVEDLFENPQHPYTKSLLSAVPRIDPERRTDRILLEGSVPSPMDPPDGCRFHTRCPELIPPASWSGTDEQFRRAFRFRHRVESGEGTAADVRERLGDDVPETVIVDELLDELLPGSAASLPEGAAETVRAATSDLAAGDPDAATERVRAAFPTPCEDRRPERSATSSNHEVQCHLVDD